MRRCKIFKSNPDTKNPYIAESSTRSAQTDDQSMVVSQMPAAPTDVTTDTVKNSKAHTVTLKTDLGLLRINLVADKIDNSGLRDFDTVPRDSGESQDATRDREISDQFRPNDEDIIPVSNSKVAATRYGGDTVVTKNVLTPDCF